jgi:hypothetical protein
MLELLQIMQNVKRQIYNNYINEKNFIKK